MCVFVRTVTVSSQRTLSPASPDTSLSARSSLSSMSSDFLRSSSFWASFSSYCRFSWSSFSPTYGHTYTNMFLALYNSNSFNINPRPHASMNIEQDRLTHADLSEFALGLSQWGLFLSQLSHCSMQSGSLWLNHPVDTAVYLIFTHTKVWEHKKFVSVSRPLYTKNDNFSNI